MSSPKRFSKGVTNVPSNNTMGQLICPDPTLVVTYMEDFLTYDPNDWIITRSDVALPYNTAGGHVDSTELISDATDGILTVTLGAVDNNYAFFQAGDSSRATAGERFTTIVGKKLWFKARLKNEDADDNDFYAGLFIADTSPVASAPSDGIMFMNSDGAATMKGYIYSGSTTQGSNTSMGTTADDTYFTVGAHWDGVNAMYLYFNDNLVYTLDGFTPTTAELAPSFGIQNGSASAGVLSVDYICVVRER